MLESSGLFDGTHFELVDGELIDKMGKKRPHSMSTKAATAVFESVFGWEFVDREAPVDVAPEDSPRNEPEPDVLALRRPVRGLKDNPRPSDIALLLEISDSTLRLDLTTKSSLYARAKVSEYWVLDVKGRRLFVRRDPVEGVYRVELEFSEHESVCPLERPAHPIQVASLLP